MIEWSVGLILHWEEKAQEDLQISPSPSPKWAPQQGEQAKSEMAIARSTE